MVVRVLTLALAQLNAVVFFGGFGLLAGVAQWSMASANIVAGVLLMTVGAWPYVVVRPAHSNGAR